MIRAEEIADPDTMFWLLMLFAFIIGLLVHTIFGARHILWTSVATNVIFTILLYSTIYRNAPSEDAMWLIGLVVGFGVQLVAVIASGSLIRRTLKSRGL